jgi:hypothetical protein
LALFIALQSGRISIFRLQRSMVSAEPPPRLTRGEAHDNRVCSVRLVELSGEGTTDDALLDQAFASEQGVVTSRRARACATDFIQCGASVDGTDDLNALALAILQPSSLRQPKSLRRFGSPGRALTLP